MKPANKGDLVTILKGNVNNIVCFCGDGTNDTCALRNADVGVALSEEASLAAPFSSVALDITCIESVIQEGRASLVTCIECFKFMTLYSLNQSISVCLMFSYFSDFSNAQYLYQDLVLIIPLSISMDLTGSFNKINPFRPISNLLGKTVLASIIIDTTVSLGS